MPSKLYNELRWTLGSYHDAANQQGPVVSIARTHGCVRNDSELPWGRGLCTMCDQCRATPSLSHPITGWTLTRLTSAGQSSFCSLAVTVSHMAREHWLEVFWILLMGSRYRSAHWDLWNGTMWQHALASWRHTAWIRTVTSYNAWMGYEYSLQNMNRPRAIHKHHTHPLETMGRVW